MAEQTLWQNIRSQYYAMTPGERKTADLILERKEAILGMTAQEIADRVGGSKSSVSRFCQRMGFDGLGTMKEAVRLELEQEKGRNFTPYVSRDRDHGKEMSRYFDAVERVVTATREQLDGERLFRVAELANAARRIYVYVAGPFIGGLAERFAANLTALGYAVIPCTEGFLSRTSSLAVGDKDLVIALSFRGRTLSVVDASSAARKAGAKTVCITCMPESRLTKVCEESIVVSNDESLYPTEACASYYAISLVLDMIYLFLTSFEEADAPRRLKRLRTVLEAERYPKKNKSNET